jgi:hypothetical protein
MRSAPVDNLPNSFAYEHCDIPEGVSIAEWRPARPRPSRRAQVLASLVGAAATLGPLALTFRGIRGNRH